MMNHDDPLIILFNNQILCEGKKYMYYVFTTCYVFSLWCSIHIQKLIFPMFASYVSNDLWL